MIKKHYSITLFLSVLFLLLSCKKNDSEDLLTQEEYYFWADKKKVQLSIVENEFVAIITDNQLNEMKKILKENNISIENLKQENHYLLQSPNTKISQSLYDGVGKFSTLNLSPVFHVNNERMIPVSQILVQAESNMQLEVIIKKIDSEITSYEKNKYNGATINVKHINKVCSLANKIYETELVDYSMPNFIVRIVQND